MKIQIDLHRIREWRGCTYGVLTINGRPECMTLEEAWRENATSISCIPPGVYSLQFVQSPKFGEAIEVINVPGRTHILIHEGNTTNDTEGCILVGKSYGELNGMPAVLTSKAAVNDLYGKLRGKEDLSVRVFAPRV